MSGSGGFQTAVEHIDAVDAFARNLYLRAKQAGPPFDGISSAVRNLHLALRHLRVEAADPDSLLNRTDVSVYARQLKPMVEDCDFALKQLVTVLDKYGDGKPADDEGLRAERVAAMRSKLVNEKTNVDLFLDTVQLHNPANKPDRVVDGSQASLEGIKDKVDVIAARLFQRREGSGFAEDEDGLWQEFKAELEKEGFAPQVLKKHKDVLRAYIRELESMSTLNGGTCPTVRGLLEHEAKSRPTSPKGSTPSGGNEKFPTGMKRQAPRPELAPAKDSYSSGEEDSASDTSESLALISTRDLMAMDSLNAGMAGMHLQPASQQYTLSRSAPTQRYLPSNVAGTLSGPGDHELSTSPTAMAASPRFVPPIQPYAGGPPPYGANTRAARLAPDRYGNEIPVDAKWTKIKRTLVSPEVLERAGVRYEARPEYVAILGHLSREDIAEFARQSAAARAKRDSYPPRSNDRWNRRRSRSDSRSSYEDDESDLFDESDSTDADDDKTSEKGTKRYLHVVDPPDKKTSPSSTVQPKPILKNKNENHVRFDPQPHEVDPKASRSLKDERDHTRRRERPPPPGFRRHHRENNSRRHSDSIPNDRHRSDRHGGSGGEYYHDSRTNNRRHHRERRGSRRDERPTKKKAWGETLGAVGIGGAAATLLSVLAEAASVV